MLQPVPDASNTHLWAASITQATEWALLAREAGDRARAAARARTQAALDRARQQRRGGGSPGDGSGTTSTSSTSSGDAGNVVGLSVGMRVEPTEAQLADFDKDPLAAVLAFHTNSGNARFDANVRHAAAVVAAGSGTSSDADSSDDSVPIIAARRAPLGQARGRRARGHRAARLQAAREQLRAFKRALEAEIVTDHAKLRCLRTFQGHVDHEAPLLGCACCGGRNFVTPGDVFTPAGTVASTSARTEWSATTRRS